MRIVIPMAGKSERFFRAGYALPKMLLPVGKRSMVEAVVNLFDPQEDSYLFIVGASASKRFGIRDFLCRLPIRQETICIPEHDEGPLRSLLAVADRIPAREEVIVNYCDFLMGWDYERFREAVHSGGYDGAIPSFRGFHPASLGNTYYAYIQTDARNEFLALREKASFTENRIQEHASTGTYYFKEWASVVRFGEEAVRRGMRSGGEYYPSLIYNLMNEAGLRTLVFEVAKFICLGTPRDYREFQFWFDVFHPRKA